MLSSSSSGESHDLLDRHAIRRFGADAGMASAQRTQMADAPMAASIPFESMPRSPPLTPYQVISASHLSGARAHSMPGVLPFLLELPGRAPRVCALGRFLRFCSGPESLPPSARAREL